MKNAADGGKIESKSVLTPDVQLFANKNIPKMKSKELTKSIASWEKEIQLHKDKILNPSKHYPKWDSFDKRYQQGLLKHWNHEIQTFEQDISDAKEELKKRGE